MFKEICFICEKKDKRENLKCYSYPYSFSWYYYHKECLKVAACCAKEYDNHTLDLVVNIIDEIKQQKAQRASLLVKCNRICKELETTKAPTGNPHQTM